MFLRSGVRHSHKQTMSPICSRTVKRLRRIKSPPLFQRGTSEATSPACRGGGQKQTLTTDNTVTKIPSKASVTHCHSTHPNRAPATYHSPPTIETLSRYQVTTDRGASGQYVTVQPQPNLITPQHPYQHLSPSRKGTSGDPRHSWVCQSPHRSPHLDRRTSTCPHAPSGQLPRHLVGLPRRRSLPPAHSRAVMKFECTVDCHLFLSPEIAKIKRLNIFGNSSGSMLAEQKRGV